MRVRAHPELEGWSWVGDMGSWLLPMLFLDQPFWPAATVDGDPAEGLSPAHALS